tara:strand:+ start:834 stop:1490 length:657 start_codon:yes stop_codon:yes gene_type:complete
MKIAFCIPGNTFSGWFLQNWTRLIQDLPKEIEWKLFRQYHPIVFKVREKIVNDVKKYESTFDTKFDYYMWIDSDINFTPQDFYSLLNTMKSHPQKYSIVSGLYTFSDAPTMMKKFGEVAFTGHHPTERRWITSEDLKQWTEPTLCNGNGMGWMLVKREVFDKVKEPFKYTDEGFGEDMIFQKQARDLGYSSYVHPKVILGHEKMVILKGKEVLDSLQG